jgi:metal-dependent amidase/aminoacylase/carboxypeptidase family protein
LTIVRPLGGDYRLNIDYGYPAGWNNPAVTDSLNTVCTDLIGAEAVNQNAMGLGAEDFSYMCQEAPGAMFFLGAAIPDGIKGGHHTNIFDIDENALPIGAAILAETTRRFLKGELKLPVRKNEILTDS